ncbi:MAG TPA: DUF2157 domain-containing protein [Gemmatimonadaceae bacterium]|nr:DUF2157 domain-containing protein [Gemmatimonadaceae bacterium]
MPNRLDAQSRADDIRAFRGELDRLERDNVLTLSPEQRLAVTAHHDALLAQYQRTFDIDRGVETKRLSLGMRVASFLGALALSASVVFLFRQYWGRLDTSIQVLVLVVAALAATAATFVVRERDHSGYFTGLAAAIALVCFVLDLAMLGQIFNVTPSPNAWLVWGTLALVFAYVCDLRLQLVAGLICVGVFVSAKLMVLEGAHWSAFISRPESVIPVGFVLLMVPFRVDHTRWPTFPPLYRIIGLMGVLAPVFALSMSGRQSYLPFSADSVEALYQSAGFLVSAAAIWLGVRRQWNDLVNAGVVWFVIFLCAKFVDWWWDVMPKSLFFLVVGLTAVLMLVALRRLRGELVAREATP